MRFELLVDYCLFENIPKEQSATYQSFKADFGELTADQFTYERAMNGSDELQEMLFIITGGVRPGEQKEESAWTIM